MIFYVIYDPVLKEFLMNEHGDCFTENIELALHFHDYDYTVQELPYLEKVTKRSLIVAEIHVSYTMITPA